MLGKDVAAGLLISRTGDPDRQAAEDLAGLLGGLPLALEQAAAYVQARGESLAGYLALFRQWRADLLARGGPAGSSQTVATTWRLAFEDLQQAEPGAVGLLRLLAFCAPEAIPLRLLLPMVERVSGPEHPLTQDTRLNLAKWTGMAGDPAGARDQFAALLPIDQRVLGPEHPDTLTARGKLAYWTERAERGPGEGVK